MESWGGIDNIASVMNRGADSAERAATKAKIKARLAEINEMRIDLVAQLGASVYEVTKNNAKMQVGREQLYANIAALDAERTACEQYVAFLEQQALAAQTFPCPTCGNKVQGGSSFCTLCGSRIVQPQPQQQAYQQQQPMYQQQAYQGASVATAAVSSPSQRADVYGNAAQSFQATVMQGAIPRVSPSADATGYSTQMPQAGTMQPIAASGRLPFSGLAIAAVIFAVFALVCAFLPWYSTSSSLQGMGSIGNALGQFGSALTGKSYGNLSFDESYAPYQFLDLAKVLSNYSTDRSGAVNFLPVAFCCWLVGVIALAVGVFILLCTKRHIGTGLVIGASLMAAFCIFWMVMYSLYVKGGAATGFSVGALACAVCCGAAIIMAIIARFRRA